MTFDFFEMMISLTWHPRDFAGAAVSGFKLRLDLLRDYSSYCGIKG
jgi:hypothetical protein